MKAAFAILPEKGHINPYIGPAQALEELGASVSIAAPGDIGTQLERAGLSFASDLIPAEVESRPTRGAELVELIQDAGRLDGWIEQLLLSNLDSQVEAVSAWLAREQPDVVVIDPLYYAAAIAAARAGLPWAAVSNSLNPVLPDGLDSALLRTVRRLSQRRDSLFARYGVVAKFRGCDVLSPHLTVAFTTEALVGHAVPGVELAGPSFPLRARGDEETLRTVAGEEPIFYVSFGSQIYHWPEVFERLSRITSVHWVFSMGELAAGAQGWRNCDVYAYAPQLEILKLASLFITHGGANSVMEGLAMGVPMLVSPMCNDQFHSAWFVERARAGRTINILDPDERIEIPPFSRDVADSYRTDGARRTAELISRLC